jgi:hypothetical protein
MKRGDGRPRTWRLLFAMTMLVSSQGGANAAGGSRIVVKNDCPITLWIHFTEMPVAAKPGNGRAVKMAPGDIRLFDTLQPFGGGRCWAYYKDPGAMSSYVAPLSSFNGFCEMTVEPHAMNYNVSLVDYASLPVALAGVRQDGTPCAATGINRSFKEWRNLLQLCPTEIEDFVPELGIGRCLSAYFYCVKGNNETEKEFCNKMHHAHPAYSALQIYGGNFPAIGGWEIYDSAAAWNRGTFAGDPDSSHYYRGPEKEGDAWVNPYNTYAKWVHRQIGAEVYAFANDDHQNHGGFVRCTNCDELDITWCPCENGASVKGAFTPLLRLQAGGVIAYRVFSATGRTVLKGSVSSLSQIPPAVEGRLSKGVYFIALYDRTGRRAVQNRIIIAP